MSDEFIKLPKVTADKIVDIINSYVKEREQSHSATGLTNPMYYHLQSKASLEKLKADFAEIKYYIGIE